MYLPFCLHWGHGMVPRYPKPDESDSFTRPDPLHLSHSAMPVAEHFLHGYLPWPVQPSQTEAFRKRSAVWSQNFPPGESGDSAATRFHAAKAAEGSMSLSLRFDSAQSRRD